MAQVYLSIGSNIEPASNVRSALIALRQRFGEIQVSTIFACPAEGFQGPEFYNLVVGLETMLDPAAVNACVHEIEDAHGRVRGTAKYSARRLDIDLLLYDDLVLDQPGLRLPREDITRYAFVLGPLAEIAGDLVHPVLGCSIDELWRTFAGPRELTPVQLED